MKKALSAALILCLSVILYSCQKNSEDPSPTPFVEPTLIKRILVVDTTLATPFDTIGRAFYAYDNLERPISRSDVQFNASGDTAYYSEMKYQYNGNDTRAFRILEHDRTYNPGGINRYYDTTTFTYSNDKLVYDSSFGASSTGQRYYTARGYTYEPGNIIRISDKYSYNGSITGTATWTMYQTIVNGNIVHQLDTIRSVSGANVSYTRFENTATYLTNPNPLAKFSDPIRKPYLHDDIGVGSYRSAPKNLFTQHGYIRDTWGASGTGHTENQITYTYTFRADGYPVGAREIYYNGMRLKYVLKYD